MALVVLSTWVARPGLWDGQEEVVIVACLLGLSSVQGPLAQKQLAACRSLLPASGTVAASTSSLQSGGLGPEACRRLVFPAVLVLWALLQPWKLLWQPGDSP